MSNRNNTATARMVYTNALQMLSDASIDADVAMLTQSDLILEQQMTVGNNNYLFPVLNNQQGNNGSTIFNTEIRLTQQDAFVVSSWGMFLLAPGSAVDATFIAQTYPNPIIFTGGASAAAETLYNSTIYIKVNNDVIYPVLSTSRFRMVPQTQQTPLITGVENANPYAQIDLGEDGFFAVEPNLVIIGSKGTYIYLQLPAALAAVTSFQRTRIHFRGVLAQNVTIIT
jgi:hypothetical protein